jgi:p-hydroxybenzoate 3-monooxygenase
MATLRTQVGIVGAGPAGLVLAHLLHLCGIESIMIEAHNRAHVEHRIRAGVLEQRTADLLRSIGIGARMDREGLLHNAIELRFAERGHRIDLADLTGGDRVMVYGQHELVKDLIAERLAVGGSILFDATEVRLHDLDSDRPRISCMYQGEALEILCDFVAGCDGFHGICRESIPKGVLTTYERTYPYAWLGILAETAPLADHLIYAHHPRGFALASMRSPEISRHYLQCPVDTSPDEWPDDRIWSELAVRLGTNGDRALQAGRVLQKGVTAMRSFVVEPMQFGRLYLAGDAAHIVPPTGAKGMNLAIADVRVLAIALATFFRSNSLALLAD